MHRYRVVTTNKLALTLSALATSAWLLELSPVKGRVELDQGCLVPAFCCCNTVPEVWGLYLAKRFSLLMISKAKYSRGAPWGGALGCIVAQQKNPRGNGHVSENQPHMWRGLAL